MTVETTPAEPPDVLDPFEVLSPEAAQAWLLEGDDFKDVKPAPLESWADLGPVEHVLAKIGPAEPGDVPTR